MQHLSRSAAWLSLGLLLCGLAQARGADETAFRGVSVETWVGKLKDKDAAVRRETAASLASRIDKSGPSPEVVSALQPVLFDALQDADAGVRKNAALAWMRMNDDRRPKEAQAKALLPALLDATQDNSVTVRRQAAFAVVRVAPGEKSVFTQLAKMLKDDDEGVRGEAAYALAEVDPPAGAVPVLIGALEDKSARVRKSAVRSLGRLGGTAKDAVGRIITALNDPDNEVSDAAARTLGQIGADPKASVPALIEALKSDSSRETAARSLWAFGAAAKAAVPALAAQFQQDQDEYFRLTALEALVAIDPDAKQSQAMLLAGLRDRDDKVRATAAYLCENLGPKAKAAVPALITLAKEDKEKNVRSLAADALKKIDPEAAKKAGVP